MISSFGIPGIRYDKAHALSHLSQAFRSLVISRRCHSALYGCWLHNFLPEVSPGSLARVQVLGRHSGCRAWGALRARGSPPSNSILPELDSSLMVQGLGIRGTARVFEIDPNTVLQWLVEAAEQLQVLSRHVLHDVRVRQVQLDELFALLSAVKEGEISEAEAIERLERAPRWVWVAMDPESKLLLAIDVGDRTLAMAQRVVHQVAQVLAPDCAPLFLTDGFREYLTALLTHYGQWVQLPRRQATGPRPKPRWMPQPQLLYAQVVKTVRRRRLVDIQYRVVFGSLGAINHVLAPLGWQIQTAFVERINLTIRQHVAAVGRRVSTLCKGEDGLRQQVAVFHCYYNFCLSHASLRQPLPQPQRTNGTGSATQWRPCTPAMAAGLTDHVWTLREVLMFRVPPWPQPAGV
jgi:IS1 family transposase